MKFCCAFETWTLICWSFCLLKGLFGGWLMVAVNWVDSFRSWPFSSATFPLRSKAICWRWVTNFLSTVGSGEFIMRTRGSTTGLATGSDSEVKKPEFNLVVKKKTLHVRFCSSLPLSKNVCTDLQLHLCNICHKECSKWAIINKASESQPYQAALYSR